MNDAGEALQRIGIKAKRCERRDHACGVVSYGLRERDGAQPHQLFIFQVSSND